MFRLPVISIYKKLVENFNCLAYYSFYSICTSSITIKLSTKRFVGHISCLNTKCFYFYSVLSFIFYFFLLIPLNRGISKEIINAPRSGRIIPIVNTKIVR